MKNLITLVVLVVGLAAGIGSGIAPAEAQPVNKSNLWYGGDKGIEVIWKTGENLAYTAEDPKIDPRMTKHARGFDQALLKIGERSYLAYGWDITSPMMVEGDDGIIIIDPPMAREAAEECMAAFRRVTDKPVRAIIHTHNHFDHVAGVKAFTTEEDVAAGKVDIYAHKTMLQGYRPEQLVELVVLPPHLAEHPWSNEYYGTVKHAVRNIYNGYLGWFQADPWALDPLPYMERAKRYVELMGAFSIAPMSTASWLSTSSITTTPAAGT